jgi:peptidase E
MTKYILAGGYIQKAEDGGRAFCEELVKDVEVYRQVKILDCMFARPVDSWKEKLEEDHKLFSKFFKNFKLVLADENKFTEQVKEADVVFLRGGETDMLLDRLNKSPDWTKELDGKTVAGTSAGAMALAKYSHALEKDELIEGLGVLPVKMIAHWKSTIYDIDWEKALQQLKSYKEDLPLYTLAEGEFKVFNI